MSTDSITFPDCVRTDCEAPRLDGLDLCHAHHQEIILGLDECKARECDKRVPFGSLWCPRHKEMREAGNLSASGERLDQVDENTPCRICGDASLRRTVGKRPQGGWNDLCQKHYDEKRATHGRSLAVARAAIPREEPAPAAPRTISIPDRLAPARAIDTSPDEEQARRVEYLLERDWTYGDVDQAGDGSQLAERWFLPVNVTQPQGGRTLDAAYEWQVGIEARRHGPDVLAAPDVEEALDAPAPLAGEGPGSEPSPSDGAPRAGAGEPRSNPEQVGSLPRSPFELEPLPTCEHWCTLDSGQAGRRHEGPCRDFAGRTEKERLDQYVTQIAPLPEPADPVMSPSAAAYLTAAGWMTDEESGRWWRPVNETQPRGGRTLEAAVAYQRNLDLGSGARVELLSEEGGHAGAVIREAILTPVMDWECYAEPSKWAERAAILVTIAAEIDHLEQELAVLRARWLAFAAVPSAE